MSYFVIYVYHGENKQGRVNRSHSSFILYIEVKRSKILNFDHDLKGIDYLAEVENSNLDLRAIMRLSVKKTKWSELLSLFTLTLFCGVGGVRTLVQTTSFQAFYMLIS
jgi:hypothetical protein